MYSLAGVAQLVEQLTCNQQVAGSSPIASSVSVTEGCPSGQRRRAVNPLAQAYDGSNPSPSMLVVRDGGRGSSSFGWELASGKEPMLYLPSLRECGSSSFGRASAFQAEGRGFDSRLRFMYLAW